MQRTSSAQTSRKNVTSRGFCRFLFEKQANNELGRWKTTKPVPRTDCTLTTFPPERMFFEPPEGPAVFGLLNSKLLRFLFFIFFCSQKRFVTFVTMCSNVRNREAIARAPSSFGSLSKHEKCGHSKQKKLNSLSCQRSAHEKLLITSTPFIAQKAFAHVPFR